MVKFACGASLLNIQGFKKNLLSDVEISMDNKQIKAK